MLWLTSVADQIYLAMLKGSSLQKAQITDNDNINVNNNNNNDNNGDLYSALVAALNSQKWVD